ncbi:MAG: WD40/YVTN/BNR-like repeat-containing protein [Cyanophyceae cyanobacterium]
MNTMGVRPRWLYLVLGLLAVLWQPALLASCSNARESAAPLSVQTEFSTGWNQVAIGGGGYVTGIAIHPQDSEVVYLKTDNGGFFRWHPQEQSWSSILDAFPEGNWNDYGGAAIALDPHRPEVVYIAVGKYVNAPGTIYKSVDYGQTWVQSDLQVPMGGDQDKRWAGERLVVSPGDSNLLLFGSRQNGLWRSTDGGLTWSAVAFAASPSSEIGLLAIAFEPESPERVYLSAYGDGIYHSVDGGLTWSRMAHSPRTAMQLAIASDTLYVTSAAGVSRYRRGTWQNITPERQARQLFNGLSVHPWNPDNVLVSLGETQSPKIFHSHDGGQTWQQKRSRLNRTVPWLPTEFFGDYTAAIAFDPQVPERVWLTDWFGVWRTDNIETRFPLWTNYAQGHEQIVTLALSSPPQGALLLSGVADIEGFYHQRLDSYPTERLGYGNNYYQDTYSIAYCAREPTRLVRVGGNRWNSTAGGALSRDGGWHWRQLSFPPETLPLRVAISATNPDRFVVIVSEGQALHTDDGGATWQPAIGLPLGEKGPWNWTQSLAADGVNGDWFYYYADGTVYRSEDGGGTFRAVSRLPPADWYSLKTLPGVAGDVWVSLDEQGLYHSTDGGETFTPIDVAQAVLFSFGKPPGGSDIPSLYLYGVRGDRSGFFRSLDLGATWSQLVAAAVPPGPPRVINVLEASQQQFGLLFVGTDGRGIYYRMTEEATPAASDAHHRSPRI